mmetsp:Transcript_50287/g.162942  ORF Transcript_50287/g.162942 Transcript_50287/m.162942 type:complete len:227 (-) Transcript_50287:93-773(-)
MHSATSPFGPPLRWPRRARCPTSESVRSLVQTPSTSARRPTRVTVGPYDAGSSGAGMQRSRNRVVSSGQCWLTAISTRSESALQMLTSSEQRDGLRAQIPAMPSSVKHWQPSTWSSCRPCKHERPASVSPRFTSGRPSRSPPSSPSYTSSSYTDHTPQLSSKNPLGGASCGPSCHFQVMSLACRCVRVPFATAAHAQRTASAPPERIHASFVLWMSNWRWAAVGSG